MPAESVAVSTPVRRKGMDILVVDDEANIRKTLALALELEDHRVTAVSNGKDGLAQAGTRRFDMVFLDIRLGTERGTDYIPRFLAASPWARIVIITAYASVETAVESLKLGAVDYLPKPFTPAQIRTLTSRVAEATAVEPVQGSRSPAMQRAFALARQFAAVDAPVLIQGERGTGRSLLARSFRALSRRAQGPFGMFACADFRPDSVDAELFGAAVGSLPGHPNGTPGRLAGNAGGILLMEGIEDLPLPAQSRLARFLREKEFERVGEAATRASDTRLLATAPPDLDLRVRQGGFRSDLYSGLAGFRILLPPLRERTEDILDLARGFLAEMGTGMGRNLLGFSEGAEQALLTYPWPGNVRELRDVVERAAILARGPQIGAAHLGLQGRTPEETIALGDPVSLDKVEETHIRRILATARSLEEAARTLGIDAATLWRRRKKYGL